MRFLIALVVGIAAIVRPPTAHALDNAWQALRAGGAVALIRHARAPGVGDPPGFRLEDCATQRNLSDQGREQARRIGAVFRDQGVPVARVLSSRWCRSLETARLAFGARTEAYPPLDSFFSDRQSQESQTRAVRTAMAEWRGQEGVLVLVTHQVNITALTGVFPAEGEVLVLRPLAGASLDLVGRVRP